MPFPLAEMISCLVEFLFYVVYECVYLAVAVPVRNNEIVSQNRDSGDIDDFNILSFFVTECIVGNACHFL